MFKLPFFRGRGVILKNPNLASPTGANCSTQKSKTYSEKAFHSTWNLTIVKTYCKSKLVENKKLFLKTPYWWIQEPKCMKTKIIHSSISGALYFSWTLSPISFIQCWFKIKKQQLLAHFKNFLVAMNYLDSVIISALISIIEKNTRLKTKLI